MTASSLGSIVAIAAAIIPSVDPQVTVISLSGIDVQAEKPLRFCRYRIAKRLDAPSDRILVVVLVDRLFRLLLDVGRCRPSRGILDRD